MFILFAIIGVCYAMLKYLPASVVQRWAVGVLVLTYCSVCVCTGTPWCGPWAAWVQLTSTEWWQTTEAGVWTSLDHSWSLSRRSLLLRTPYTMVSLLSVRQSPRCTLTHLLDNAPGKGRSDSSLNQDQREQKIDVCPSLLEYFTFIFNFHSFLAGLLTLSEITWPLWTGLI